MHATGLYAGVPQDENAHNSQPREPSKKHHVPAPVKTVSLAAFCVLTVSLTALLLWSAAPSNQHNGQKMQRRHLHYPRQNVVTMTPDSNAGATTTMSEAVASVTEPPAPGTTNPDAFVPLDSTPTDDDSVTMTTNPDAYVPLDPSTTPSDDDSMTMTTNPDAYVPLNPSTATIITSAASTAEDAFVPLSKTDDVGTSTTAPEAYVPLGPSATGVIITRPTAATFVVTTTGANIPGGTLVVTATGTYNPDEPLLITATGTNIPGGSLVVTRTGPLVVDATNAPGKLGSSGSSFNFSDIPDDSFGTYNGGFTVGDYFIGAYLPTVLAVVYGIIWSTIFASIAEITPFFQLTRPGGATVSESLCLEYRNAGLWRLLASSISHKDGLVFAGALVTLIVTASIAFASQVFHIGVSGTCRETGKGNDCIRYLAVNRPLAWAECGMLAAVLLIVAVIIFARRRRSTGVYAEVTSVAGIAVLMQNPTVVARIRESVCNHRNKRSDARTTKYGIGKSYDDATGWTYGFAIVAESEYGGAKDERTHLFDDEDLGKRKAGSSVLPWLLRPWAIITFQLLLLILLGLILYYWFNGKSSPFEDFMNSQTFGPKLMMSCFGIVIRLWWAEISNAVHTLEPYRRLLAGHATAHESVLASTGLHAASALATSLRRGHRFAAWIALLAVLAEILIVALSAIPFNLTVLIDAFRASVITSVAIIALMAGTLPFVLRRYRGSVVAPPTSVADTVVLLADPGNEVVGLMGGMVGMRRSERDAAVEGLGRRYKLEERGKGTLNVGVERDEWAG